MAATSATLSVNDAGRVMAAEIEEQPAMLSRIVAERSSDLLRIGAQLAERPPAHVVLLGRGTSQHALWAAKYLIESRLGWLCSFAAPSLLTSYGTFVGGPDTLVLAASQSGASPDLVDCALAARRQGAKVVALTNVAGSPLAEASHVALDLGAGPELAVAATKSYTAQLLHIALLVAGAAGQDLGGLDGLGDAAASALDNRESVDEVAASLSGARRLVTVGRGLSLGSAKEGALKLMETNYIAALAFSGADVMHGPLALLDDETPTIAIVPPGRAGEDLAPSLRALAATGSPITAVGSRSALGRLRSAINAEGALRAIPLPNGIDEALSPVIEILPLQLLALHTAVRRGLDPDQPRRLNKVTRTS
jgi:glucosamine--fructose-6-phosphate aminotransferase (isomerizing)